MSWASAISPRARHPDFGGDLSADAKNNTVSDPVDSNFSIQTGKDRSRGFEFEARAGLGDETDVIAAYSYTDAKTLDGGPLAPDLAGKRTGASRAPWPRCGWITG